MKNVIYGMFMVRITIIKLQIMECEPAGGVFVVHLQIEKEMREFPLKKDSSIGYIPIG